MKNPFKKSSVIDTVVNVGIGGAANVAMDYIKANYLGILNLSDTTYNAVKIAVGAIGGSMISGKYARAAVDGIATVGAANLIDGLLNGESNPNTEGSAGAPFIGRARMGQRGFRRAVRGTGEVAFMQ